MPGIQQELELTSAALGTQGHRDTCTECLYYSSLPICAVPGAMDFGKESRETGYEGCEEGGRQKQAGMEYAWFGS